MSSLPTLGAQKDCLRQATLTRTRNMALQELSQEYERARENINCSTDLRVLNSMIKRIRTLNHPRCAGRGIQCLSAFTCE